MTKKQQGLWEQYKRAYKTNLYQCYANPSVAKRAAYRNIQTKCFLLHGWDIRIPSYNTMMFTMAFLYKKDGKTMLHYETPNNTWDFEVPADQL